MDPDQARSSALTYLDEAADVMRSLTATCVDDVLEDAISIAALSLFRRSFPVSESQPRRAHGP